MVPSLSLSLSLLSFLSPITYIYLRPTSPHVVHSAEWELKFMPELSNKQDHVPIKSDFTENIATEPCSYHACLRNFHVLTNDSGDYANNSNQ